MGFLFKCVNIKSRRDAMKKKGLRKRIWFGILFIFTLGIAVPTLSAGEAVAAPAPEKVRLIMGGASTTTWIYSFSAIVIDVWKRYLPNVDVTLMATGGSTANYIPLDKGEMDLGGATTYADYWAMNGMYFTKNKLVNFCSLIPASKAFNHVFTLYRLAYQDPERSGWEEGPPRSQSLADQRGE